MKSLTGNIICTYETNQAATMGTGEDFPDNHEVKILTAKLTDPVEIDPAKKEEFEGSKSLYFHNIDNVEIVWNSGGQEFSNFNQVLLKDVVVEFSDQKNSGDGILGRLKAKFYGVMADPQPSKEKQKNSPGVEKVEQIGDSTEDPSGKREKRVAIPVKPEITEPGGTGGGGKVNEGGKGDILPGPVDSVGKLLDGIRRFLNSWGCSGSFLWILLALLFFLLFLRQCYHSDSFKRINEANIDCCENADSLRNKNREWGHINDSIREDNNNLKRGRDSVRWRNKQLEWTLDSLDKRQNEWNELDDIDLTLEEYRDRIFFYPNSNMVLPSSGFYVNKLAQFLQRNRQVEVLIEGHFNGTSTVKEYENLDIDRATRIKDMLVELGVSPRRITTKGYANTKMNVNHDEFEFDENGIRYNRNMRVEIKSVN